LAAIGGINANENAAKRQFFGDNQQRKDLMLGQYMQQLGAMGGQENKAWEWNKAQPYLNAQEAAQALNQSSAQNAAGALGDLAAGVGGGAKSLMMGKQMDLQSDQMKQMMELLGYGAKEKNGLGGLSDAEKVGALTKGGLPTDNSLTKGLTEFVLPKNTDANIPPAAQIATNPTTPTIATTVTGQVLENGKPKTKTNMPMEMSEMAKYAQLLKLLPYITGGMGQMNPNILKGISY